MTERGPGPNDSPPAAFDAAVNTTFQPPWGATQSMTQNIDAAATHDDVT